MRTFFTSDWHFHHANIIKFCPDFRNIKPYQMTRFLIDKWNHQVQPNDVVYNLGDLSFSKNINDVLDVLRQLNGIHHFIVGNHDNIIVHNKELFLNNKKADGNPYLTSIKDYAEISVNNQRIVLSHYPLYEWNRCHRGSWMLYGHIHNKNNPIQGRALNVGYDLHGELLDFQTIHGLIHDLPIKLHHDGVMPHETDILTKRQQIREGLLKLNQVKSDNSM